MENETDEVLEESFTNAEDLTHLVELCSACTSDQSWYDGGKLATICGRYDDNQGDEVSDSAPVNCVSCLLSNLTFICSHCGSKYRA